MVRKYTKKGGHGGLRDSLGRKHVGLQPPEVKDFRPLALRCRDYDGEALRVLINAMMSEDCPWPSRLVAVEALLSRGHGKPLNISAKMDLNAFAGWNNEQLDHLINDLKSIAADDRKSGADKAIEGSAVEPAGVVQPAGPETGASSSADIKRPRGSNGQSH